MAGQASKEGRATAPSASRGWLERAALGATLMAGLCALMSALLCVLMVVKRGALDPIGLMLLLAVFLFAGSGSLFYYLSRPRVS